MTQQFFILHRADVFWYITRYYTWRQNKISSKIYKNLVQQTVQQKVKQKVQQNV